MNLRFCFGILLLILSTLLLAGCNRERPAPTPVRATAAPVGTTAPTSPPPAIPTVAALPTVATRVALPSPQLPTPVPLVAASPTPPPPAPLPQLNPTATPATGAGEQYFIYKVALGDTLGEIAEKFGVTPDAILSINTLADPDVLMVGQELKIPGTPPAGYGGRRTYTVRPGDTLSSIALRFGVSVAELQQVNNIRDEDQIFVGQELVIPASSTVSQPPTPTRTYTVQPGDTLFSIALRHGVTVWALQVANNISDPDAIYPGQVLVIP
jgi:LysM repeat protein